MAYAGDPDRVPRSDGNLLSQADAELREAAARVEQLMREDYERFLAGSEQEPRLSMRPQTVALGACVGGASFAITVAVLASN